MRRIGIFSGSFDPVHKGHIAFAMQAATDAKLDKIYFAPEAKPRYKEHVTHIAHRLAMLRLATAPHPGLEVLELPDRQFTASKTLPRLHKEFAGAKLFLVVGSDMLEHMPSWPLVGRIFDDIGLIVGIRTGYDEASVRVLLDALPVQPKEVQIIASPQPGFSSKIVRQAISRNKKTSDIVPSVQNYIAKNWLYHPKLSH